MELSEKIRELITKNLIIFDDDVVFIDDDNIFEKGFVNSLFAMKLVTFIEDKFDIEVDNDDLSIANFSTINKIVSFIEKKKG